jgi:hypothetical protein
VTIDRAVLTDFDQLLLRLTDYPRVVRAIERSIDCGDFVGHIRRHVAQALEAPPQPNAIRRERP